LIIFYFDIFLSFFQISLFNFLLLNRLNIRLSPLFHNIDLGSTLIQNVSIWFSFMLFIPLFPCLSYKLFNFWAIFLSFFILLNKLIAIKVWLIDVFQFQACFNIFSCRQASIIETWVLDKYLDSRFSLALYLFHLLIDELMVAFYFLFDYLLSYPKLFL